MGFVDDVEVVLAADFVAAAEQGNLAVVRDALAKQIDVNCKSTGYNACDGEDVSDRTALHQAALNGHISKYCQSAINSC